MEKIQETSLTDQNNVLKPEQSEFYNLDNLIRQKKIGSGTFGKVYLVKDKQTGQIFAAKISKKQITEVSEDNIINLFREIDIISKLDHPSILKFIGYCPHDFKNKPNPVIIMEYSPNGSLDDLLQLSRNSPSKFTFDDTLKLTIIFGIASAMSYLHLHNIIHRDLKPANILLSSTFQPKIADFGLSKINQKSDDFFINQSTICDIKGTPKYMAPEIWYKKEYSKPCDVYAFALVVYEIMTNDDPFPSFNIFQILSEVQKGYRPEFRSPIAKSYKNLIERCWQEDPNDRPTFDEIVKLLKNDHGFITENVNENQYMNYTKLIEGFKTSFNSSKFEISLHDFIKNQMNYHSLEYIENKGFFSFKDFIKLDDDCQYLAINAESDLDKMYSLAINIIEGRDHFEPNVEIGLKYLKKLINKDDIRSIIYYINMLIKGKIIPMNLKKATKFIENKLKSNESKYFLMKGKVMKKEKNYSECLKCFIQSMNLNDEEAMYELGKIYYKGFGSISINKKKAIEYFKTLIDKNFVKAMFKYGLILIEDENNKEEGMKYIKLSADKGCLKSIYYYYSILDDENVEKIKFLKRAAYKGHVDAMYLYGIYLKSKESTPEIDKQINLFFKKSSDKGNIDSLFEYSLRIFWQKVKNGDMNIAAKNIEMLACLDYGPAMYYYSAMLESGLFVPINQEESLKFLKMAIDKGNTDAMTSYAMHLLYGDGIEEDTEEGLKYLKMAVDHGNKDAIAEYGNYLFVVKRNDSDMKEGIKYLKIAAQNGDSDAMENLATLLLVCDFFEDKVQESIKYYQMAISKGNTSAMKKLALLYYEGRFVEVDKQKALKYFKMAADFGDYSSMNNYAMMIFNGEGTDSSYEDALRYLKVSADNGSPESMYNYSSILAEIDENNEDVMKYLKMAADNGFIKAVNEYAFALFTGDGVETNKEEALRYIKIGFEADDKDSYAYGALMLFINKDDDYFNCFMKAFESGETEDLLLLAKKISENKDEFNKHKKDLMNFFKKASDDGNTEAMFHYSTILMKEEDNDNENSKEEANKYLEMAAENGNLDAISLYTKIHLDRRDVDKSEAFKYYKNGNGKWISE